MRIGLVTGEYPPMPGGIGDFSRQLAIGLARLGAEVHVITDVRGCDDGGPGVRVHPVVRRWSLGALWRVRNLASRLSLDILNVQYQAAAFGLSAPIHIIARTAGRPTVVTFHDLRIPYLFPKAGGLRPRAVSSLARSAAGVIATDPAEEAELRGRGVRRLVRIPIGSNIQPEPPAGYERAAWRAAAGVAAQDFLLGYFGFLSDSKGGDTLISALSTLRDRKSPVRLALIGGGGSAAGASNEAFAAGIDKMIGRYDLQDRIIRTGYLGQPEVSGWLLACDAAVLPYRDGVSFRRGSLLAALAHGLPVISTQPARLMPELRDGDNIRLVPPGSAQALVLAVTGLLEAPELRARMGQAARELAAGFRWDEIARRTLDFYESV
jgi:glycosyltransferase involved in cell wall biosynthesis